MDMSDEDRKQYLQQQQSKFETEQLFNKYLASSKLFQMILNC